MVLGALGVGTSFTGIGFSVALFLGIMGVKFQFGKVQEEFCKNSVIEVILT